MTIAPSPQANIKNRSLYIHDNLRVMRGINSNSIDLIATDPPFNSLRLWNAPGGSKAANQQFDDRWTWDDITDDWYDVLSTNQVIRELIEAAVVIEGGSFDRDTGAIDTGKRKHSVAAFLVWMAPRLIEMHRILKPTGQIYLHCDYKANSYLRLLMDAIFGRKNFRNEIVWCYGAGNNPEKDFRRKHDTIFRYVKNTKKRSWTFNTDEGVKYKDSLLRIPYSDITFGYSDLMPVSSVFRIFAAQPLSPAEALRCASIPSKT